jgi:Leucine-rich repeat (LRR) protein
MKKLYPLLSVLFLIYWGCEDKTDDNTPEVVDDTPTEVTLWGEVFSVEDTDTLYLGWNQLTGSIPSEIGILTNLTGLSLYNNQLTGSIPPEIGNLTNLESLSLWGNCYSIEYTTEINLSISGLTGEIPPEIGNLTNLNRLY